MSGAGPALSGGVCGWKSSPRGKSRSLCSWFWQYPSAHGHLLGNLTPHNHHFPLTRSPASLSQSGEGPATAGTLCPLCKADGLEGHHKSRSQSARSLAQWAGEVVAGRREGRPGLGSEAAQVPDFRTGSLWPPCSSGLWGPLEFTVSCRSRSSVQSEKQQMMAPIFGSLLPTDEMVKQLGKTIKILQGSSPCRAWNTSHFVQNITWKGPTRADHIF
nr:uncharacterized protein LOC127488447 [Oryctolagus cuniculus]